MSELATQRQINRGYDDGLARSVEFVLTPLFLGAVGFGLDAWLGTRPLLAIALGLLGAVGIFVKMWLGYDREMRRHEADASWRRSPAARAEAAEAGGVTPAAHPTGPNVATSAESTAATRAVAPAAGTAARPSGPPRPGYVSALAATFRFFRNQADTGRGTAAVRARGVIAGPGPSAPAVRGDDDRGGGS